MPKSRNTFIKGAPCYMSIALYHFLLQHYPRPADQCRRLKYQTFSILPGIVRLPPYQIIIIKINDFYKENRGNRQCTAEKYQKCSKQIAPVWHFAFLIILMNDF